MAHGQHVMRGFAIPLSVCMQVHWHIAGGGELIDNGIFHIRTIVIGIFVYAVLYRCYPCGCVFFKNEAD